MNIIFKFFIFLFLSNKLIEFNSLSSSAINLKPTIQIVLLIHGFNKVNVLPFALSSLSFQNYPKNRVRVLIYLEIYPSFRDQPDYLLNNSRHFHNCQTYNIVKKWINTHSQDYHKIDLNLNLINENVENSDLYWSRPRFENIIKLKSLALSDAQKNWADYVLFFDADVILTNQQTFLKLINSQKIIISPMLYSFGTYSNFWAGMNKDGYYFRTQDYLPILERRKKGQFQVPMIHSCVLIDLRHHLSQNLTFNSFQLGSNIFDDMITFALSAFKNNLSMIIDNEETWGYIPPPIENLNLDEIRQNVIDLELTALTNNNFFPLIPNLELFVQRPKKDKLNVDQVYIINLERRKDRYDYMRQSLNILGIDAIFWKAIDGKQLSNQFLEKNEIKIMPNYLDPNSHQPMTMGEVGCFLSHYYIWKDMIAKNYSKIIIFEDDVRFTRNFKAKWFSYLESLENYWTEVDFIYLGRKFLTDKPEPAYKVKGFVKPFYSYWTIGYLITDKGVKKLLDSNPLLNILPVDEYLPIMYDQHPNLEWSKYFSNRNLNALSISPLLISPIYYVGDELYYSDTSPDSSAKNNDLNHVNHSEL